MSSSSAPGKPSQPAARLGQPEIRIAACLECGTPLPTQLLELARMDLTFITDRPLRFGTAVQLAVFSDFISCVAQSRAIVHWCRPHATGWQVGAFLSQPLPDRLTEFQWSDLRSTLRHDCNWKAWVLWEGSGDLESVRILNYSIIGLRMQISRQIVQSHSFSLFASAGARGRVVLNGQVQWCRQVEDSWHIGGLIHGQRGRELPKLFGNLNALHVAGAQLEQNRSDESLETMRFSQELEERFLAPAHGDFQPSSPRTTESRAGDTRSTDLQSGHSSSPSSGLGDRRNH